MGYGDIGYTLVLACIVESSVVYHEPSIITFLPPFELKDDAHFGYSMAYETATKRLIISAPTADNIGHMYSVHIEDKTVHRVPISMRRENPNVTHNYWLGAAVSAGADFFVTCAPRYIINIYARNLGEMVPTTKGKCVKVTDKEVKILPLPVPDRERFYDAFGWSIHTTYDNTTLIGGLAKNAGQVLIYHNLSLTTPPTVQNELNEKHYNYGYSITSTGLMPNDDEAFYLISNTYFSKVRVYNRNLENVIMLQKNNGMSTLFGSALCTVKLDTPRSYIMIGDATRSMVAEGYDRGTVTILKHNPTEDNPHLFSGFRDLVGTNDGAYFGRAIINLGDIDGDKYEDVAVAAPYENEGRGAVYIYMGRAILNFESYMQRIQPEGFRAFGLSMTPVKNAENGVCTHLAIGAPDSNRVAFFRCMSCATVHLIVDIPSFQEPSINTYFEVGLCIKFKYPENLKGIDENFTMKVEVIHSSAKLVQADKNGIFIHNVSIKEKMDQYCQELGIVTPTLATKAIHQHLHHFSSMLDKTLPKDTQLLNLRGDNLYVETRMAPRLVQIHGNFEEPIQYAISLSLDNDPAMEEVYDSRRVRICKDSVTSLEGSVRASDCGADVGFCRPDVRFHSFTSDITKPYVIGSSETETFEITILNEGETAYQACMRVWVLGANVLHPGRCSYEDRHFLCVPPHSLHKSDVWDSSYMKLEMFSLTSRDQNITIHIDIYNRCDNTSSQNVTEIFYLQPDMNGIVLHGLQNPDPVVQITADTVLKENVMDHIYTIINNGSTNWVDIKSVITIKKNKTVEFTKHFVTIIKDSGTTECKLGDVKDKEELEAICYIGHLKRNRKVTVIVPLEIQSFEKDDDDKNKNVTVSSKLDVILINETIKTFSLNTTIMYVSKNAPVPLWITVTSSVSGAIVLLIITVILYKVGFLQRKNKYKLERFKKSLMAKDPINVLSWMSTEDLRDLVETPDVDSNHTHPSLNNT